MPREEPTQVSPQRTIDAMACPSLPAPAILSVPAHPRQCGWALYSNALEHPHNLDAIGRAPDAAETRLYARGFDDIKICLGLCASAVAQASERHSLIPRRKQ